MAHDTGRFGGIEFLVLEIPEPNLDLNLPETENQSSVVSRGKKPETENPSPGFPAPEKATLINNNIININKLNNKTAADIGDEFSTSNAAAVFLENQNENNILQPIKHIEFRAEDSLIGEILTKNQLSRINALVLSDGVENTQQLEVEIKYCLLSAQSFSACGQDFARKLNAIRSVLKRGDWQTPVGLLQKDKTKFNQNPKFQELRDAQAEKLHFEKLISNVDARNQSHFQKIIERAKIKIERLQFEIEAK